MAIIRSTEPKIALWMMTGRSFSLASFSKFKLNLTFQMIFKAAIIQSRLDSIEKKITCTNQDVFDI